MKEYEGTKSSLVRLYFTAKMALNGLTSNLLRTFLTVLGILIGVASVVSLMGIGEGARRTVVEQFESLGKNVVIVKSNQLALNFDPEEYLELLDRVDGLEYATSVVNTDTNIRWRRSRGEIEILGVNEQYPIIRDHELIDGNFFSSLHVKQRSPVAVLGYNVAVSLLNGRSPVGQSMTIDGISYRIIGVLSQKGEGKGEGIDNKVIIPYTSAMKIDGNRTVSEIWGKSDSPENAALSIVQLGRIYKRQLGIYDKDTDGGNDGGDGGGVEEPGIPVEEPTKGVGTTQPRSQNNPIFDNSEELITVTSLNQLVKEADNANRVMTLLLGGIAAVSLLVGGLGIMNIMLVAVSERTSEIGVRRALGAKKYDLLIQFILEALYVSIIGCIIGIAVGIYVINLFNRNGLDAVVSLQAVKISTVVALTSGLLFGVYPAYMASNLPPVEALNRK
ncbi:MAG: ABC transporter permease [Bacillota bacterium]|nr:ABC transporter permease [Bacillota bacterium]